MNPRTLLALSLLTCCSFPAESRGDTQPNAKIQLHLLSTTAGNACAREGLPPTCASIISAGDLAPAYYYAYVLVTDADSLGIAGVQFGIQYDGAPNSGIDVFDWRHCASIEFQSAGWPGAGTGNLVAWSPCQTGASAMDTVVAVAGYLYVGAYSPDDLRIIARPVDGLAKVADCDRVETTLPSAQSLGRARFSAGGAEPGYSPCGTMVVSPTCEISGPSTTVSGTTTAFTASSTAPGATFAWSVTGQASIEGPSTGGTVQVRSESPGAFLLRVQFTGSDGSSDFCLKSVSVTSASTCFIVGPRTVVESSTVAYAAGGPGADSYQWSLSGSGTIIGSATDQSVEVLVGQSGLLTISLVATSGGSGSACSLEINVLTEPPPPSGSNEQAKILVGLSPVTEPRTCVNTACAGLVTAGRLDSSYHAYVMVADGYTSSHTQSGIAGVQFGVEYDAAEGSGVDVMAVTICGDYEFPGMGWPASGGGNRILWRTLDRCQFIEPGGRTTGVVASACYFYLTAYTPGAFRVRPRPDDGVALVIDCNDVETVIEGGGLMRQPSPLGYAEFSADGKAPGYNPCGLVPVQPTTWSRIKTLFRE